MPPVLRSVPDVLAALPGGTPPLRVSVVKEGRARVTVLVRDARGRRWVLRRAVDDPAALEREHELLLALEPTDVPAPRAVAWHQDGAGCSIIEHVDGIVLHSGAEATGMAPSARGEAGRSLVRALALVHAADPAALGLPEPEGRYAERELRRWRRHWRAARRKDLADLDHIADRLALGIPPEPERRLLHGSCRLENAILGPDGRLRALIDWELWSVGDPLADLGLLLACWPQGGDRAMGSDPFTVLPGFADRDELVDHYAEASGRDLQALPYYRALAAWKVAILAALVPNPAMGARADLLTQHAAEAAWRAGL